MWKTSVWSVFSPDADVRFIFDVSVLPSADTMRVEVPIFLPSFFRTNSAVWAVHLFGGEGVVVRRAGHRVVPCRRADTVVFIVTLLAIGRLPRLITSEITRPDFASSVLVCSFKRGGPL